MQCVPLERCLRASRGSACGRSFGGPWRSLCVSRDIELSSISTQDVNKQPVTGRKEGVELPREDALQSTL
jgi:hypothetical protein